MRWMMKQDFLMRGALVLAACGFAPGIVAGAAAAEPPAIAVPDPALTPPPVNLSPGPEYADSARAFQGIPSIERAANGRLWVLWYGGGRGEGSANYAMLATSGDDGATWSPVKMVIDPDRDGPVRALDPCLWIDPQGRLWVFWTQWLGVSTMPAWVFAITTEHPDQENPTWSKPRLIGQGCMLNKPTVLSSGEWLLPVAVWHTDGSTRAIVSKDQGATFELLGTVNIDKKERGYDEPMFVERRDGSLWTLVRWHQGIGESFSTDRGKTWSDVAPSAIRQTPARFFIRRLHSGRLLLIKHSPPDDAKKRSYLTAYLSADDGKTWDGGLLLEEGHASYPDAVEGTQGIIYAVYDFGRVQEKQIRMTTFTEEDVLQKKAVSGKVRMQVVNQATGVRPKLPSPPKP